jgi:hypothetical protein
MWTFIGRDRTLKICNHFVLMRNFVKVCLYWSLFNIWFFFGKIFRPNFSYKIISSAKGNLPLDLVRIRIRSRIWIWTYRQTRIRIRIWTIKLSDPGIWVAARVHLFFQCTRLNIFVKLVRFLYACYGMIFEPSFCIHSSANAPELGGVIRICAVGGILLLYTFTELYPLTSLN